MVANNILPPALASVRSVMPTTATTAQIIVLIMVAPHIGRTVLPSVNSVKPVPKLTAPVSLLVQHRPMPLPMTHALPAVETPPLTTKQPPATPDILSKTAAAKT